MFRRLTIASVLLLGVAASAAAQRLDAPALSAVSATRSSVTLEVVAGAGGAPGGFVVEWMTLADYQRARGWPGDGGAVQGSDFTGRATLHVAPGDGSFLLEPGEAVQVVVGRLFDETGVSATDYEELPEGTAFVFRACASAAAGLVASLPSAETTTSTSPPGAYDCTLTQGYWKNHPESWTRVTSLALGATSYDQAQLLAIFAQPARGNGLVSLAHELIAAKLNLLLGATPTPAVAAAIGEADALIGSRIVPPVGGGALSPGQTSGLTAALNAFDSGTLGPGHCSEGSVLLTRSTTWGGLKSIYR
jgi:hypothetical protein